MKARKITKTVVGLTTELGTSMIVSSAITHNLKPKNNPVIKTLCFMGRWGLSGVAGQAASRYMQKQVDEVFDIFGASDVENHIKQTPKKD